MTWQKTRSAFAMLAAGVAAVSLLVVGAVAPTAAAVASCQIGEPKVTPTTVVVGPKSGTKFSVDVKVSNCSPATFKKRGLELVFGGEGHSPIGMETKATYQGSNVYRFRGSYEVVRQELSNEQASGKLKTRAVLLDKNWNAIDSREGPSLDFQRKSTEKISVFLARGYGSKFDKGDHLEIYSWLQRVNWETGKYNDYYGPKVDGKIDLEFKKKGGTYKRLARGSEGGPFFVNVTVDGCYRTVFRGDSTSGSSKSPGECIDVV